MKGQHTFHVQEYTFAEWLPLIWAAAIALFYLGGVLWQKNKKSSWNHWRTFSFVSGMGLLCIAMMPSLAHWAHVDLRGHMVQHLLIGMFAPILLVLGAPITLALKILPVRLARGVTAILKSKIFQVLSHPVTALLLNIGGMYVLYLTPLYSESFSRPYLHHLIHLHFLSAGYLFTWSLIGPDPAPRRPGFRLRLTVLFLSIAAHAFLSKYMYANLLPLDSPHSHMQIREAAQLMYYWGDLAELFLAIAFFAIWYSKGRLLEYTRYPFTP